MSDRATPSTPPTSQKETDMTDTPDRTFLQAIAAAVLLAGLLFVMNTLGEATGAALHVAGVVI